MKACPLMFQHPSEAQQLNGLGPKLCDRLTDKLKEYCAANGLPEPEAPGQSVHPCCAVLCCVDANGQGTNAPLATTMCPDKRLRNRGSKSRMCRRYGLVLMPCCSGWGR